MMGDVVVVVVVVVGECWMNMMTKEAAARSCKHDAHEYDVCCMWWLVSLLLAPRPQPTDIRLSARPMMELPCCTPVRQHHYCRASCPNSLKG
jgi:hypothetical protein